MNHAATEMPAANDLEVTRSAGGVAPHQPLSSAGERLNFCEAVQSRYRTVLRRLGWPTVDDAITIQTLGITSCTRGEGVSTVALQLAATAAGMGGQRVLLVDANVPNPAIARRLGLHEVRGFTQAVQESGAGELMLLSSPVANLSILAAGAPLGNVDQVYDSPALAGLVNELKADFDLVVFDLPPAGASSACLRLAELLDGVLLVVAAERVRWQAARRVRDLLLSAKVRLIGAVLNHCRH